jgi:hypothetical protein
VYAFLNLGATYSFVSYDFVNKLNMPKDSWGEDYILVLL